MALADKTGDLSANTLYAARWDQTSSSGAGTADLQWIRLGHATDSEIKAIIDKGISFLDIFDTAPVPAIGFVTMRIGKGQSREYLRLKPGMEKAAAFLETRRYAAYLGATTEFSTPEGMAFNRTDKKLYLAMSKVVAGMANDYGHIQVAEVKSGAVYEINLDGDRPEDQSGKQIEGQWVAGSMESISVLTGSDRSIADRHGNTAAVDGIANPDNLSFSPSSRYLFIGEDSSKHVNNYLWAYDIDSGDLIRLFSVPAGAEVAGLEVIENLNGFMYLLLNYQHPGGKGAATDDLESALDAANPAFDDGRYRHAGVGYLSIEGSTQGQMPWM
jgi:secreted PhoX family phosphatase